MKTKGQFHAATLSHAARRAARAHGITTALSWNALSHARVTSQHDDNHEWDIPVAEIFGTNDTTAIITAGDIYFYSSADTNAPMAKV